MVFYYKIWINRVRLQKQINESKLITRYLGTKKNIYFRVLVLTVYLNKVSM